MQTIFNFQSIITFGSTSVTSGRVLILFFLTLIPWPAPTLFKISCSRDSAKVVRKIVESKWIPVLEKFQVSLPLECPFHPARDIFQPQHAARLQHRPSQWSCGFCGKSFYEETYLDMHFDNRHKGEINKAEDAVCLADYCDIMRCHVLVSQDASFSSSGSAQPSTDVELWSDAAAYRTALTTIGPRNVAMVTHPTIVQHYGNKHSRNRNKEIHNCPKSAQPPVEEQPHDDSKPADGVGDGDANHTWDLLDSALPPVDQKKQKLLEIQKLKASCDPEQLHALKLKCEQLVRDCIASLLLHLTLQDFKEIEEQMNGAVCWYLSCDRYWQDAAAAAGARSFPWALVLAVTGILTAAICMCYYIIWIVFDSGDGSVTFVSSQEEVEGTVAAGVADPNDHYIYVTYPPELKRRLLESCYNRTTRL